MHSLEPPFDSRAWALSFPFLAHDDDQEDAGDLLLIPLPAINPRSTPERQIPLSQQDQIEFIQTFPGHPSPQS
jgi:hypothetical protein